MPERRIAVLLDPRHPYVADVMRGVVRFAHAHGPWTTLVHGLGDLGLEEVARGDNLDGVIADLRYAREHRDVAEAVIASRLPAIAVSANITGISLPQVIPDDAAAGATAAEEFLRRGFRNFAFCGFKGHVYSDLRQAGFMARLEAGGRTCAVYHERGQIRGKYHLTWEQDAMTDWLAGLPRPVGILACTDLRARHVVYGAHKIGLKIPEEAAVIGVDNEEIICEMLNPPLSSIPLDGQRAGWLAAELLNGMIDGGKPPDRPILVAPRPLVTRRSSDILAIADPDIAQAMRFIWEHADREFTVEDVLRDVMMSRRGLEIRFRRAMGRTPQKEIWRVHVERAKKLLADTDWSMPRIARAAGFKTADRLTTVFRRETGIAPSVYRARLDNTAGRRRSGGKS